MQRNVNVQTGGRRRLRAASSSLQWRPQSWRPTLPTTRLARWATRPAATPTSNTCNKVQNIVCNEKSMSRLEGGGGWGAASSSLQWRPQSWRPTLPTTRLARWASTASSHAYIKHKQKIQNMVCNETSMSRLEGGEGWVRPPPSSGGPRAGAPPSPPLSSPGGPASPAATPTSNRQKVQNMVCNETSMSRLEGGGGRVPPPPSSGGPRAGVPRSPPPG